MDALTTAALVGTSRAGAQPIAGDPTVDGLVTSVEAIEREWAVLLQAGARSIYHEAGQLPTRRSLPLPDPAPVDDQPVCSPPVAVLLDLMLREHEELLPEALQRMIDLNLRVPPQLLPLVLGKRLAVTLRPALCRVIGQRGRWLAQFNSMWRWATETPLAGDDVPSDAETIWNEGTLAQRVEVLRCVRAADPAKAREWIAATWKQERAEMRGDMIRAMEIGLSVDDEPLLERALDDRAEAVRQHAAQLLVAIPASSLVQRMIARADDLLHWEDDALHITLPRKIEPDAVWKRDGMPEEPSRGTGKGDWLLRQILMRVPLAHWQERFGAEPAVLIAAAGRTDRGAAIIGGWTRATHLGQDDGWLDPLWSWWGQAQEESEVASMLDTVLHQLPGDEAERRVQAIMRDSNETQDSRWVTMIEDLPRPWSEEFAHTYLTTTFTCLERDEGLEALGLRITNTLDIASLALPPIVFDRALLTSVILPAGNDWKATHWQHNWDDFTRTIALRQRIQKEIA